MSEEKKYSLAPSTTRTVLIPHQGSAHASGGSLCGSAYAERTASTAESVNEVAAHGDTGAVSVQAFLDTEGREIWHGPHGRISLSAACLELILLFLLSSTSNPWAVL